MDNKTVITIVVWLATAISFLGKEHSFMNLAIVIAAFMFSMVLWGLK